MLGSFRFEGLTISLSFTMSGEKTTKSRTSCVLSRTKREPYLEIQLDQHFDSKIYTSGSVVSGCVEVTTKTDVGFEALELEFTGITSTNIHLFHQAALSSSHTFLQLKLPISSEGFPKNRMLEAEQPYSVPFTFDIPHQLTSTAWQHCAGPVHERHLQLPPTVGSWEPEEFITDFVKISYVISARLVLTGGRKRAARSIETTYPIRVMPLFPERPPLHIESENQIYRMSQRKAINKDLLSRKLAYLFASAAQPNPVILSVDDLKPSASSITVDLKFTPTSTEITAPDVYAQSASLEALTNYSLGHISYLPDQQKRHSMAPNTVEAYCSSHRLALGKPGKLVWEQTSEHLCNEDNERKGSDAVTDIQERTGRGCSTWRSRRSRSDEIIKTAPITYRARLLIYFKLPITHNQSFLPTFYSCLACRTYSIRFVLATSSYGTTLSLTVPLQIAAEGYHSPPDIGLSGSVSISLYKPLKLGNTDVVQPDTTRGRKNR